MAKVTEIASTSHTSWPDSMSDNRYYVKYDFSTDEVRSESFSAPSNNNGRRKDSRHRSQADPACGTLAQEGSHW
jgi:hypothetical protein